MPKETVHRFYMDGRLATECSPSGSRSYLRNATSLLAQHAPDGSDAPCLLATDANGSVIYELDTIGAQHPCYAPYGERSPAAQATRPMAFNGEPLDRHTGGYLLGNGYRLYNPTLRRFASPDEMSPFDAGGPNAYAYCAGDPVNRTDPSGRFSIATAMPWFGLVNLVAAASAFIAASVVKDADLRKNLLYAGAATGAVGIAAVGVGIPLRAQWHTKNREVDRWANAFARSDIRVAARKAASETGNQRHVNFIVTRNTARSAQMPASSEIPSAPSGPKYRVTPGYWTKKASHASTAGNAVAGNTRGSMQAQPGRSSQTRRQIKETVSQEKLSASGQSSARITQMSTLIRTNS